MKFTEGGVCAAKGFQAGAMRCGIRKSQTKKDLAMIRSDVLCNAAAVYTLNRVKAAPVLLTKEHLADGKAQAVIVNSGNANACAPFGIENARREAKAAARALGVREEDVIVASTGVIGQTLPIEAIEEHAGSMEMKYGNSLTAAEAIMTTDTVAKEIAFSFTAGGKECRIGAICKGVGMICPNMATMLCFILTDADISSSLLQKMLGEGVEDTFNMISVDGDTSTNDTCLILANGEAGNDEIVEGTEEYALFKQAVDHILMTLACMIVKDGEGAGRFIEVKVEGAKSKRDAKKLARSIVSSNLVKAAFFGSDANWGRILCAMGYSKADFNPDEVDLVFSSSKGSIEVLKGGRPHPFSEEKAKMILQEKSVSVLVVLHDGEERATAWGCDLTYDYVRINGDYRS